MAFSRRLIVYGVGSSYANLKDIESLLGLPALTPDDSEPELRGWTVPDSLMNKAHCRRRITTREWQFQLPAKGVGGDEV